MKVSDQFNDIWIFTSGDVRERCFFYQVDTVNADYNNNNKIGFDQTKGVL
jgi:hypothetical protein